MVCPAVGADGWTFFSSIVFPFTEAEQVTHGSWPPNSEASNLKVTSPLLFPVALLTKSPLSFLNVQAGRLTATSATAALEMDIGWPSFADAEAPFDKLRVSGSEERVSVSAGMTDFKDRLKLADAEEGALTV